MKISEKTVVQFHYTLRDEDTGVEIENSRDSEPVAYLHGSDNIISGLEKAMEGHETGDTFTVVVEPQDGYGLRNENNQQRIPVKHLMVKKNARLKPGMVVSVNTDHGPRQVVVIKAGKFNVDVDTNHPLAGKRLGFEGEIVDVREATEEEVAHGHAHGVGGHHHE